MFYCDGCAKKNGWPETRSRSHGKCEMCKSVASCNDMPSKYLPSVEPAERAAVRIKVRAFASGRIHIADTQPDLLVPMEHVGHAFIAVPLPAAMLCQAVLRSRFGYQVAVKMPDEMESNCRACKTVAAQW